MRKLNTAITLRALYNAPALTMAQLIDRTHLSRRTTELILGELGAEGWVRETSSEVLRPGAGRPPRFFEFVADHGVLIGVQVEIGSVTVMLADMRGAEMGRRQAHSVVTTDADLTLAAVRAEIEAILASTGIPLSSVAAGTICMGGTISDDGSVVRVLRAPSWTGVNPGDRLAAELGFPVFAENDANAAALGEHWRGSARDADTFTWLIAGALTGAGIVIRGEIYRGVSGAAGEIAHAEALGLRELDGNPFSDLVSADPDLRAAAQLVVDSARAGDERALAQLDAFVVPVTRLLLVFAWSIAPPVIVLGGGLEAAGDLLVHRLHTEMERIGSPGVELRPSSLGRDAVLVGAVKFALDHIEAGIFGPHVA